MSAVEDGRIQRGHSRWYDIDSTVRTAIQMLEKCSPETKKRGRPPEKKEDVIPTNSASKRRGRPPKELKQEKIVETVKSSTKEQSTTKPDKEISYDQYRKQEKK